MHVLVALYFDNLIKWKLQMNKVVSNPMIRIKRLLDIIQQPPNIVYKYKYFIV